MSEVIEKKKKSPVCRLDQSLYDVLEELAEKEYRSIGMQCNLLLRAGLQTLYPEWYDRLPLKRKVS